MGVDTKSGCVWVLMDVSHWTHAVWVSVWARQERCHGCRWINPPHWRRLPPRLEGAGSHRPSRAGPVIITPDISFALSRWCRYSQLLHEISLFERAKQEMKALFHPLARFQLLVPAWALYSARDWFLLRFIASHEKAWPVRTQICIIYIMLCFANRDKNGLFTSSAFSVSL